MNDVVAQLRAELSALSPEERAEFDRMAEAEIGKPWKPDPRNKPQVEAYYSAADILLYGGQAGGGKLQPTDSLVLTPFGWKQIGELRVGSKVCATDGTVTEVIGVFPQGEKDLYRVTMDDGGSTEAGLEHNWLAWRTDNSRKIGNERVGGAASACKYTTAEMIARMEQTPRSDGRQRGFAIPVVSPVAFNVAGSLAGPGNFVARPIDPYLLGVLLGDGCITNAVSVTSADEEILQAMRLLAGDDMRIDVQPERTAAAAVLRGQFLKQTVAALKDLGLYGHRAESKFIPKQYKWAPVAVRWSLLQGLMDTDGWAEPKRACYYTTISRQLAEDVVFLARSLGAVTTVSEKTPSYTYDGGRRLGQKAYCVRIRIRDAERCFRLERKRAIATEIDHQSDGRFIESIKFSRRAESVCIQVRHPNSLYITDDFIVTHNTDLLIGCATTMHEKAVIFRNQFGDLAGIEQRILEIYPRPLWNAGKLVLQLPDTRLELGALWKPGAEYSWQGRPHDFVGFDEGAQISLAKVSFVIGWLRSVRPGQRKRVIIGSNPPVGGEGDWLVEWFAPWLDPLYPNPARPGELRWSVMTGAGKTIWVDGPGSFPVPGEEQPRLALSRTFIPAGLKDNAYLANTGYEAQLDALPEPLRTKLKTGDFMVGRLDHEYQVIPTSWVEAAQERWKRGRPTGSTMAALGVDVAQGGLDKTSIARLWSNWFDEILSYPGAATPDGPAVAGLVVAAMRGNPEVAIDLTGGWGISARDHLVRSKIEVHGVVFSAGSNLRSRDGKFGFLNRRAELWWQFREALDPDTDHGGDEPALPPSRVLKAQLTTPRWKLRGDNIIVESKDDIRKRLGTSTDEADAVIMAWCRRRFFAARKKFEEANRAGIRHQSAPENDPFEDL